MSITSEAQRAIMRTWATGVTIVTTHHDGHDHGLTVSSFTSVSLEPPQVLVVIAKIRRTLPLLRASRLFGVNVLRNDQLALSNRFANYATEDSNRFEDLTVIRGRTGVPLIPNSLAYLECEVVDEFDAGNNVIVLGQVVAGEVKAGQPLLYWDRNYRQLIDS